MSAVTQWLDLDFESREVAIESKNRFGSIPYFRCLSALTDMQYCADSKEEHLPWSCF